MLELFTLYDPPRSDLGDAGSRLPRRQAPIWGALRRRAVSLRPLPTARRASNPNGPHEMSLGSMDEELTREFSDIAGSKGSEESRRSSLEIWWQVKNGKQDSPAKCPCCEGTGHRDCNYCATTGFATVGDHLIRNPSTGGACDCPVCRGTGQERCRHCNGTGMRASWLGGSSRCPM